MGKNRCAVASCTDTKSAKHRFPVRNDEALRIWLERLGDKNLKASEKKKLGHTLLCSSHFIPECHNGKFIARNSLPSINMPAFTEEPSIMNSFLSAMKYAKNELIMDLSRK